jgi:predicted Zn-dependent peptidase
MAKEYSFRKTVLSNGIRVLTEKVPGSRAVSIGVWVTAGSRDEPYELSGVSHFIEHMIFKGTENRSALDIAKTFDRLGGFSNAFTSKETTCFHAKVLDSHLDIIMDLLSDIFLNSVFDPREVERERQVILQEISMVEDSPDELVHELFNANFWRGNPVERSILGQPDTVARISSQTLKTHMQEFYTGKKVLISASGNIDHDDLCSRVDGLFSCLGNGNHLPSRTAPSPNFDVFFRKKDLEQTHILIGLPGPASTDPDRYKILLMNVILGGSMSSRLFQEVREKRGLAYAVYSFVSSLHDSGLLGVYAGVAPENTLEAVSIIKQEMEKMAAEPVGEAEIQAAKDNIKGGLLLSSENTDARMSRIARNEIDLGQFVSYEEVVEEIEAVTPGDIRKCSARLLENGMAAAFVGPCEEKEIEACREKLARA